jgi:uncharacterized membrane protein YadS
MNNQPNKWRLNLWQWLQLLLSIAVLASAFLVTVQSRSPAHTIARFLALAALFALGLANYQPQQRKIFTRGARGVGILCLFIALLLLVFG